MIPFEPFEKIQGAFLGRDTEVLEQELFQVKQVHGDRVLVLNDAGDAKRGAGQEADAVLCSAWGLPIAVRTADCVPILVAHPDRLIGVVHAGWRGTAAGILVKTLRTMAERYRIQAKDLRLAIGPAIGPECYEVGEDVYAAFQDRGMERFLRARGGKYLLDLPAANAAQAMESGVPVDHVEIHPACTLCRQDVFFSHRGAVARGEAKTGRNYSWLMISP